MTGKIEEKKLFITGGGNETFFADATFYCHGDDPGESDPLRGTLMIDHNGKRLLFKGIDQATWLTLISDKSPDKYVEQIGREEKRRENEAIIRMAKHDTMGQRMTRQEELRNMFVDACLGNDPAIHEGDSKSRSSRA